MTAGTKSPAELLSNAQKTAVATSLNLAVDRLRDSTDTPRLEAEVLLAHTLGSTRAFLYAHPEHSLHPDQLADYQMLVERRARGEPLPYLTGHIEFFGLDFAVDDRVLIPRPETEVLVEAALALIRRLSPYPSTPIALPGSASRPALVDVGTGSGCIAITLAVYAPQARIYVVDVSPDALAVARANARRHRVGTHITFLQSDLLTDLPEAVDLIIANPPYIAREEWPDLLREVREYEPRLALDGGADGLERIRQLLSQAPDHLRPEGAVLLEIGATQGPSVTGLARQAFPDADITIHSDLAGRERVLLIKTRPDSSRCVK